jgi:hypothetical protein
MDGGIRLFDWALASAAPPSRAHTERIAIDFMNHFRFLRDQIFLRELQKGLA